MKKIIALFAISAVLSGCATVAPTAQTTIKDQEPILVGISMKERVAVASKDITNQIDLLNKINENRYAGTYNVVKHNNELEARKNSSNTVPQAYSRTPIEIKTTAVSTASKIKKIDWKDSSLNELVKGFGEAAGYKVILVAGSKDKNVSFYVENENVFSALNRLKVQVSSFALITVVDSSKTIYLNYN